MKEISESEALRRCAAYCSKAERCVYDVRKKLQVWELAPEVQVRIVTRLQKEKFIDEARYCRAFVRDKARFSLWGKHKIVYALRGKQIADDLIHEALNEIDGAESELVLTQLLQKKAGSVRAKDRYELRMKLLRFGAGRGFSLEEITRCLANLQLGEE